MRNFHKTYKSKYCSIYKNKNFETRFVLEKEPLQKWQHLWHSALIAIHFIMKQTRDQTKSVSCQIYTKLYGENKLCLEIADEAA